ncbi:DUF732 domain-containing protein [Mycolicibacterium canariasense]|uniref:DUF732 domain-containing protein n=1 Tax=Mycolicibacterium canariasense TaxID=228230 RepID=UPI0032D56AFD
MGGEADYDEALPGAQTELAPSASETEAHTAWALDDGVEWEPPFWSAARITAAAAAAATLLTVGAVVVGFWYLRDHETVEPVVATPTSTVVALPPPPPPVTVTTVVVQQPPTTVTQQAPPPVRPPVSVSSNGQPVAPSVLPDLTPYNDEFLEALRLSGWVVWNPVLMTQRAHSTCSMLRDGEPRTLISQKLVGVEPQLAFQTAMQFTNLVTAVYPHCP